MKILLINSVCGIGSTGRICAELAQQLEQQGHTVKIAYGRLGYVPPKYQKYAVRIGNNWDVKWHGLKTRLWDGHGFGSVRATQQFLKWADTFSPDLVWLHNIHGYYINIELLFNWLKAHPSMQKKWTLHDCWAFTGHCSFFAAVRCDQWKTHCQTCPQTKYYPATWIDRCAQNFDRKKQLFCGVKNMTLLTPSQWLKDQVKQSFLQEYPIEVHYNTIDTTIFKPTPSDFRARYGLTDKKIILGVANVWEPRKGFEDFLALAAQLPDTYRIVLVGVNKKQKNRLPAKNCIGIARTNSPQELAAIYSAADIFFNPSEEETFGMTTLEAISCGTQAVVYNGTACAEIARHYGGDIVANYQEFLDKYIH